MSTDALRSAVQGTPAAASSAVAERKPSALASFDRVLQAFLPQLKAALPAHLRADRMARLALTAFSTTEHLAECEGKSVLASLMTAGQLGLEPGVNGQGYLIPYFNTKRRVYICTFVPGWKGLTDLVNRSGRAAAWTGAVYKGDEFDYSLGSGPFVSHKPGGNDDPQDLLYAYAIGRVNGAQWPIVEVWPMSKIWRHRDKYNRQGNAHYSMREPEMYARKVPLLQALKYLPASIEIAQAIDLSARLDTGTVAHLNVDGMVTLFDGAEVDSDGVISGQPDAASSPAPGPKGGRGKASAPAAAAPASAAAPEGAQAEDKPATADDLARQVLDARSQDDALAILDLARSTLGAEGMGPVSTAYKAKFPPGR